MRGRDKGRDQVGLKHGKIMKHDKRMASVRRESEGWVRVSTKWAAAKGGRASNQKGSAGGVGGGGSAA